MRAKLRMGVQASASVQHMVLPCHWTQRPKVIGDLVRCYGACGRTIVCARPCFSAPITAHFATSRLGCWGVW